MKKSFLKYVYGLLLSVSLVGFVLIGIYISDENSVFAFSIQSGSEEKQLKPFVNENGEYYVFLPSYIDMSQVGIVTSDESEIILDGEYVSNGKNCGIYQTNEAYNFSIDNHSTKITFLKSSNVATLFLETVSEKMDYIHENKNHKEYARMILLDETGYVDYSDEMCSIKGRGNYTWVADKKPYLIELSKPFNLLGMPTGQKWVLLSNSTDESNLNNKLVYDLGKQINFDYTVDCQYTDVYLNGEYNGLYLLTTKVEIGEERLDIDVASGDFLGKIDLESRWDTLNTPIKTAYGRTIEITQPSVLDNTEKLEKEHLINQMENMVMSGIYNEEGFSIDLESWVKRYLVDEITANIDADLCSSYFYYTDNTFYAGPLWDYDMVLGNSFRNNNAKTLYSNTFKKSANNKTLYYNALCKNNEFNKNLIDIYREEFIPILCDYIDNRINTISELIENASYMNSIRWRKMFDDLYDIGSVYQQDAQSIVVFLKERIEFLNKVWLENEKYYTLQFEIYPNEMYMTDSIPEGGRLRDSMYYKNGDEWINSKTEEPVNPDKLITEDMVLVKKQYDVEPLTNVDEESDTRIFVVVMSVAVFVSFLGATVAVDIWRRKKERGNMGEK